MKQQKPVIVLTDHARLRCKQSGTSESLLIAEASKIPSLTAMQGELKWRSRIGIIVLERSFDQKCVIKTFISRNKMRKTKKSKVVRSYV